MTQQQHNPEPRDLARRRVAITGRLASMPRRAAIELIERHGGIHSPSLTRATHVLVVGEEGWPLQKDGRLTRKLRRAQSLQRQRTQLEVIPEDEFLERLGISQAENGVRGAMTLPDVSRLLKIPRSRIEAWIRGGLLAPTETLDGIPRFKFAQVTAARSLVRLIDAGAKPQRIARSLRELERWMPQASASRDLLACLLSDGSRLVLRSSSGDLLEPHGQRLLDFDEDEAVGAVPLQSVFTADRLFDEAVQREQQGDLDEAAELYRRLLLEEGLDPDICFNLANVLYALGDGPAAAERLRQAIELDPEFVDAWYNLANILAETGRAEAAADSFRRVLSLEPQYADALYGLADALEQLGQTNEAQRYWRAYLNVEPTGEWADYARSRLTAAGRA